MPTPSEKFRRAWVVVGWLGVLAVIYLSLTPRPPEIDIEQGDKLGHLLAYGTLMLWFAQHRLATQQRLRTALGLVALGVALEFVQRWTGYRTYSYADMAANTAGVLLGWLLAPPRLPNLSALAEQMIVGRGS